MSTQLEWKTDEDGDWEEITAPHPLPGSSEKATKRTYSLRFLFILLFLLSAMIIILVRRQVLIAEAGVREEVLAINTLAVDAANEGDVELFRTLISGRDASWTETQIVLATQELALGNSARLFGLEPQTGIQEAEIVYVSPDLHEVELELTQHYRPADPGAATPPVALTQSLIYRRGQSQWLLSPPDDESDYWGTFQSLTGRYLTILYPSRDTEIVQRMATDLEADLAGICAGLAAECPADWHIVLRLERNPASVLSMAGQKYIMNVGSTVVMPTPSLVGLPVDDAGYAHLYQAYATYIVGLTLTRVVEYECCRQAAFYSAILNWFMADASLSGWPLAGTNYFSALEMPISVEALENLYSRPSLEFVSAREEMVVHAFVEFMLVKAVGRGKMIPDLAALPNMTAQLSAHNGFWGWVESMSNYSRLDEEQLVQDWMRFISARGETTLLAFHRSVFRS